MFLIRLDFDLQAFQQSYDLTELPDIRGGPVFRVDRRRLSGSHARL